MAKTSAQRKLLRGIEQVKTLCGEAEAFENSKAYVFRTESDMRSPHEIHYRSYAIERKAPPDHWPLLAGEAIQNMRSALDHAVWGAASPRKRTGRTGYPIFTDPCEFQVYGRRMLEGVPASVRTLIEETQPYLCLPQAPTMDALELLRTFSNIDKHRTLHAFAASVPVEFVGTEPGIKVQWQKTATDRELGRNETEISVLIATSETEFRDVDVKPGFTYEVRIEGRPLDFLPVIARRVIGAVTACESGEAPAPFSTYPI